MSGAAAPAKRNEGTVVELWVVRHAIAEERSAAVADEQRALTAEGRERFDVIVTALATLGARLDGILTSPWRRAVETTRALAVLSSAEPEETDLLAGAPGERLLERIRSGRADRLAVVGHEPWLSELVSLLVSGDTEGAHLRMKKGGVARLEGEAVPGGMELLELLPPRVLRRI